MQLQEAADLYLKKVPGLSPIGRRLGNLQKVRWRKLIELLTIEDSPWVIANATAACRANRSWPFN